VAVAYLAGAAVASVSPTPGGLGALEAALVAGLTAVGGPAGPAVAGVLAFRLLTFWLPILPGWMAYRTLRANGTI
jgi:glycosyltransferase 2 family protein